MSNGIYFLLGYAAGGGMMYFIMRRKIDQAIEKAKEIIRKELGPKD